MGSSGRPGGNEISFDPAKATPKDSKAAFVLKEGCKWKMRIEWRVQRKLVSGMKFKFKVNTNTMNMATEEVMMGSYAASKDKTYDYPFPRQWMDAPSGWTARGTYYLK